MISYDHALKAINNQHFLLNTVTIPLDDALHHTCVDPIYSIDQSPQFNNSAMDGYAIHSSWVGNTFPIADQQLYAGDSNKTILQPDHALYITTGSYIPDGYDCIIPIENCKLTSNVIIIQEKDKQPKNNIRFAGTDFNKHTQLIPANTYLSANLLMLLASAGIREIRVKKKLRVVLIATGDEVLKGHINDTNLIYLLSKLKERTKIIATHYIPDNRDMLRHTISKYVDYCDIIITTGGVSRGEKDYISKVVSSIIAYKGGQEIFHRLAIKPGKPQYFAKIGSTFFFGLPGNPVAVTVGFTFFIEHMLQQYEGIVPSLLPGTMGHSYHPAKPDFTYFLKATVDQNLKIQILEGQESYKVLPFTLGNAFAILSSNKQIQSGDKIMYLPF